MDWFDTWALSLAVFLPTAGAIVVALMPKERDRLIRALGILFTAIPLGVGLAILFQFDFKAPGAFGPTGGAGALQFEVNTSWISAINARYHLGADGISLPLLELTLLLSFLSMIYTWRYLPAPGKPKAFVALQLLLETGMAGTFVAFDLPLFFVFWELVLVPMYFLIGIWGSENREYAAVKFFLYTLFGSVFMLLGFLALFFASEPNTFDIVALQNQGFDRTFQLVVFAGLFLGFAIKVPMWPFHTWLPDAHTEAPTVGSVVLAGVLLKMGTYGFVRIALPILPDAAREWAPWIGVLAVIAIIYAALACLAQKDLKRLIAFSSVGHMGFVMLGIATLTDVGINAAIYGMVAHGVITGMLFFIAGSVHERYHTREIAEIGGGMLQKAPYLAGILAFTAIASLGLPGLAGFWGEVMSLLAAYSPAAGLSLNIFRTLMVLGGVGTVLTAGYFLWMLQRVNLGQVPERWAGAQLADVNRFEYVAWAPLLVFILALGLYPRLVFGITNQAVESLIGLL
ncbi:MAG: complex I subunit 4 family protein [Actinomycetota bacterium]